ncbi:MAG: MmgE/PrpD family protein, partial [Rhizobiales bacterium]|nr:MmgE/PrpD family protein [Hyphomicrobiales bacterium]
MNSGNGVMEKLIDYVAKARTTELPPEVLTKTKHHILDTLAAMVSGATLKPGDMAFKYARLHGSGTPEATVVASDMVLPVIPAAIANGMLGHSDETDDSNGSAGFHPGCAILPASLAMAEREGASGAELVRSVALGYDIGSRVNKALGRDALRARSTLPFSIAGTFGASAAAGCLAGLTKEEEYRFLFSYAAQQASGVMTYARDTEHVEKAFIFGGMPARNGLTSATMVQAGFSGVWDVLSGDNNFFLAFTDSTRPANPDLLVEDLGSRFEIMLTNMKKFCTGFPIQSAMEALLIAVDEHGFKADDVEKIVARLPVSGAHTVNDREMPDINLQYLFACALLDGEVTFDAAHDVERMTEASVMALRNRMTVVGDPDFGEGNYQSIVEITLKDGSEVSQMANSFRGKSDNPMSTEEVEKKALDLIAPSFGAG